MGMQTLMEKMQNNSLPQLDELYKEIILEHYRKPHGREPLERVDYEAEGMNPLCGDEIHITARIKEDKISEILFTSSGCAISKASASLFTEHLKGQSIKKIKEITQEEVLELLEVELTPARTKCALLVYQTIRSGIK